MSSIKVHLKTDKLFHIHALRAKPKFLKFLENRLFWYLLVRVKLTLEQYLLSQKRSVFDGIVHCKPEVKNTNNGTLLPTLHFFVKQLVLKVFEFKKKPLVQFS